MQILLKQTEIETAIKDYVTKQGIKLQGRSVEIVFTSGRKENGVTADMCISDDADDFPVFISEETQTASVSSLVRGNNDLESTEPDSLQEAGVLKEPDLEPTPPTKPSSLFGA